MKQLTNRKKSQSGQSLIEYLILVSVMGIATIGIVRLLGHNVKARLTEAVWALNGQERKVESEKPNEKHYQNSDLSNFFEGAQKK